MKLFNTWQVPRFTKWDIVLLLCSLFPLGVIRALAYVQDKDGTGADVLGLVQKTAPLEFWGAILSGALFILAIGLILRNHILIWAGHALNALIHFVLIIGIVLTQIAYHVPIFQSVTYFSFLITPFLMHFILMLRTGARPLSHKDNLSPVETVVGDHAK